MKTKYQLTLEDTPDMIERDGFGPPEEWVRLGPPIRIGIRAINAKDERYLHLHGTTVTLPLVDREIPVILGLPHGQEAAICRSSAVNPLPDACPYSIQRKISDALWSDWGGKYMTADAALIALQLGIDNG